MKRLPRATSGFAIRELPACFLGVVLITTVQPESFASEGTGMPGVNTAAALQGKTGEDQALSFDSDFLYMGANKRGEHVDLAYFAHKGGLQPGRYAVQVTVNGKAVDEGRMVNFRSWPEQPGKLYACVNAQQMAQWWGIIAVRQDVKEEKLEGEDRGCPEGGVAAMVPLAKEQFDFNKQLLVLTVPQASLGPASRLRTSPQMWDQGMAALLMNYNYSGSQQQSGGRKTGSDYLGINGQMNLQGWRIRNDLTAHKSQGENTQWNATQTYAQHDFASWGGGQFTVGNTTSSGSSVGSVQFTGVKLDSDDAMLDPKFTTYSPAITGIANSPSTITVRQYGRVVYQQNVPQGPFSLTDFNRSGNGDVEVEIREADGRTRYFTMAQAQSGALLRQGGLTWSTSAGKATNGAGYADDKFVQAGMSWGVWANTTLNGGTLLSRNYQALTAGASVYAGLWGAVSYALNASRAELSVVPGEQGAPTGVLHAVSWSRSFGNTSVGASWRHSQTRDFYSYAELLTMKPRQEGDEYRQSNGTRDSYSVSLSQSMGVWGSLSLSGARSTTWGSSAVQNNLSLSYNTTVKDIGIGMSLGVSTYNGSDGRYGDDDSGKGSGGAGYSRGDENRTDRTVGMNVSLPLGKWLSARSVNGTYSFTRNNGEVSQQVGINGSALNGALSYAASQGLVGNQTGNTSLGYSGRYGSINGGYSYGADNHSVSYGASGGLAIHPHGVTLGKQLALGGGNALVEVPGVGGLNVNNAVTDWRGYALVSGLTPYDMNRINVDMANLPGNVELDTSSKNVVPTRGALVAVPFRSNKGYRLLLNLQRDKGEVPFGSTVALMQDVDATLPVSGIVGEAGQVYLYGMPQKGTVTVNWGDGKDERCTANYVLPDSADQQKLVTVSGACH
ncbi:MAG: fimbria/pilus outer membrane usher protein [Pseudomonadota bacterium]